MIVHDFVYALIGGGLIGMATVGYLYVNGRIAGISGLISQALELKSAPQSPAIWFLFGLFITPFFYGMFVDPVIEVNSSPIILAMAGLLVGLGPGWVLVVPVVMGFVALVVYPYAQLLQH